MLLRRFISQQTRAMTLVSLLMIASMWVFINLVVAVSQYNLSLMLASSVVIPTLILISIAVLIPGLMWLYNRLTSNLAHRRLITSLESADSRSLFLNDKEKNQLVKIMKSTVFFNAVYQALESGFRSITIAKKAQEKVPYRRAHDDNAMRVHINDMPRKVFIEFHDENGNQQCDKGRQHLEFDNSYSNMYWNLHVKPGNKVPNGEKRQIRLKDNKVRRDHYHPLNTTTGSQTICYPTIAVNSQTLGRVITPTVTLRRNTKSGYYIDFMKNNGPTIGAQLSRRAYMQSEINVNKSLHTPPAITTALIAEMLKQVGHQLSEWYEKTGMCHGDVKMENICWHKHKGKQVPASTFTLIDYPDHKGVASMGYTEHSSILSDTHDFITKVTIGLPFRLHSGVDYKYAMEWALAKNLLNRKVTIPTDDRESLERVLATFDHRIVRTQAGSVRTVNNQSQSSKQFIIIHKNTFYHDTFALTYLALVMVCMMDESDKGDHKKEQAIFKLLEGMIQNYIDTYKTIVGSKTNTDIEDAENREKKNLIINEMNKKCNLAKTIEELTTILAPNSSKDKSKNPPSSMQAGRGKVF